MSNESQYTDTYEAMAQRCEQGAQTLDYEAEHAAEILRTRAGGDQADPQEWAAQKRTAAQAARNYAAGLRAEAGDRPNARMARDRLAQADQVALAAELGGNLIDGRRIAERDAQRSDYARQLWDAGTHPAQERARELEATDMFTHVAETINGVEQVPFWRLGGPVDDTTAARTDRRVAEDGDEA